MSMTVYKKKKLLLSALHGEENPIPPIWLMRQAGRYLPEYQKTRQEAGDFLSLCYNPKLAEEVTLQPIRRYNFDAAILFADILLIPDALNRNVHFKSGKGPLMQPLNPKEEINLDLKKLNDHLSPVYETVDRLKSSLPQDVTLIGFAGAPWTVATYMIAGEGTPHQEPARKWVYEHPEALERLLSILTDATIEYLRQQVLSGAEVIKLFDSWAGSIPGHMFDTICLKPISKIARALKQEFPDLPIIILCKGATGHLEKFAQNADIACLALDHETDLALAYRKFKDKKVLQGNLDPLALEIGGNALKNALEGCLEAVEGGRKNYIFNLGHGIRQHTPPENVETVINYIRNTT